MGLLLIHYFRWLIWNLGWTIGVYIFQILNTKTYCIMIRDGFGFKCAYKFGGFISGFRVKTFWMDWINRVWTRDLITFWVLILQGKPQIGNDLLLRLPFSLLIKLFAICFYLKNDSVYAIYCQWCHLHCRLVIHFWKSCAE